MRSPHIQYKINRSKTALPGFILEARAAKLGTAGLRALDPSGRGSMGTYEAFYTLREFTLRPADFKPTAEWRHGTVFIIELVLSGKPHERRFAVQCHAWPDYSVLRRAFPADTLPQTVAQMQQVYAVFAQVVELLDAEAAEHNAEETKPCATT
jgi:hypothetical protein